MNTPFAAPRRSLRPLNASVLAVLLVGVALCVALDVTILNWIRVGPPEGKGELFFFEFVLLLAAAVVFAVATVMAPPRAQVALAFIFIVVDWHTGFQLSLTRHATIVITATDVLVLLTFLSAFALRWPVSTEFASVARRLRAPMLIFGIFCIWALFVSISRQVPFPPMISTFKAFVLYPLIALIIPWCLSTWRQLYAAIGVMLILILERAVEGLRQGTSTGVTTVLTTGEVVSRITGNFASVNQYAFYLMSGLLIAVALIVGARSKRLRLALMVPIILVTSALILTLSRGAWLGIGAGTLALVPLLRVRRWIILVGVVVTVGALVSILNPSATTLISGRLYAQESVQERQGYITLAEKVIAHYPLGAGWGAFFADTPAGLVQDKNPEDFPWYHNDYLDLASEAGIGALAVFLWIWGTILFLGLKAWRLTRDKIHGVVLAGLLSALIGMLVQANTDQFFWHADVGPHIWIVAGLLLAAVVLTRRSDLDSEQVPT